MFDIDYDYREIDLDSIETSKPRSTAREHVVLEALRFLGLDEKLAELGFNGPRTAAVIETIIGRAFITVLAYHLVPAIRFRLKQVGIHSNWANLRKILST